MSLHEKSVKAYKEWISVKKTKPEDFRAPSSIFFLPSLPDQTLNHGLKTPND